MRRAPQERQKQDLLNKVSLFDELEKLFMSLLTSEGIRYLYPYTFRKFCQQKTDNSNLLKSENRSIRVSYVFDMLVMEFIMVSPRRCVLIIQFLATEDDQETGTVVGELHKVD